MTEVAGSTPPADASVATWEMSTLHHVRLRTGEPCPDPRPGPRWLLVRAGAVGLEAAGQRHVIRRDDAALLHARTAHRLVATQDADVVVADLRLVVPTHPLPSPLVVRGFGARHPGVTALVDSCPLGDACRATLFSAGYATLIGAALTSAWLEDGGARDADRGAVTRDEAVAAVLAAITDRPGDSWTLERMAGLAHLSRSALAERFRRALGRSPAQLLREIRMQEARRLLDDPTRAVEHVAHTVGYGSSAAFSRAFSSHHGLGPQAWRDVSRTRDPEHAETDTRRGGGRRAEHERSGDVVGVEERAS